MQREAPSYEALLQGLVSLRLCLYPTATEARIQELSDDLSQIQERCTHVKNSISHRQVFIRYRTNNLHLFISGLIDLSIFRACLHLSKLWSHVINLHLYIRLQLLEPQLSQLELFDQALLTLTQRSENFLSGLRDSSQVDTADLEAANTKLKVRNQYFAVSNHVFCRLCLLEQLQ